MSPVRLKRRRIVIDPVGAQRVLMDDEALPTGWREADTDTISERPYQPQRITVDPAADPVHLVATGPESTHELEQQLAALHAQNHELVTEAQAALEAKDQELEQLRAASTAATEDAEKRQAELDELVVEQQRLTEDLETATARVAELEQQPPAAEPAGDVGAAPDAGEPDGGDPEGKPASSRGRKPKGS